MINQSQVREFITALTGSDTSMVTFQVFHDPKPPYPQNPKLAATWTNTLNESLDFIAHRQSEHCGVYMTINETDGEGRDNDNITKLRVFFADFDGQAEPKWDLTPHLIQKRDETHGHAFWLIDAGDITQEQWTVIQRRIAMYYDTDTQVIDPARVVRIAGTKHFKDPNNPAEYVITSNQTGNGHRYTVQDILNAHVLDAEKDAELNSWFENRQGNQTGVGYERSEYEEREFISFLTNAAHPAVDGSGSHEVFRVASYGHDHGIPLDTTQQLMWEHYNPRCIPPWSVEEAGHFYAIIARSYKYAKSAAGCKTAKAGFQAIPLQEPEGGWEVHAQKAPALPEEPAPFDLVAAREASRTENRLSSEQGAILAGQMNAKSSHYDFALVFDAERFNGADIIRQGKQFFVFNGKSWETLSDEYIRNQIQDLFACYKPADSFTSGIFRVFCDLVTVKEIENGRWLSDPERDTSNLVVFNNGIVDMTNNTIMPHTNDFFTFNHLPFDFNPNAKCPAWQGFLTSIWDNNNELKLQLQQWMGYCLTSSNALQKFAVFMGKSRGGKGVITDVISEMVGRSNIASPSLSALVKDSSLKEMSTSSITLIPDAHNVNINIRDSVLSTLKAITGDDTVSFHEMYKGSRSTKFSTKITMSTNNVPDFVDSSGALVNRMIVFPFKKTFKGRENTNLRNELFAEIEGILQWAIEGLRLLRLSNNVFTECQSSVIEKEDIREDMFPLAKFVKDNCDLKEGVFTSTEDIYNAYRMWCSTNGTKNPMTSIGLSKHLRNSELPIFNDRRGEVRGFVGIEVVVSTVPNNVIGFTPIQKV